VALLVSTHHKAVRINKTEWNKAYGLIVNVEHLLAAYLCRLTKIKWWNKLYHLWDPKHAMRSF